MGGGAQDVDIWKPMDAVDLKSPRLLLAQLESNQAVGARHVCTDGTVCAPDCVHSGPEQGCEYQGLKQLSPAQCLDIGPFL